MKKVTLKGTGQLNGPIPINKSIELEDSIANKLLGSQKEQILGSIMSEHYPGVQYETNKIGINISEINKVKEKDPTSSDSKVKTPKAKKSKETTSKNNESRIEEKGFRDEIIHFLDLNFEGDLQEAKTNLEKLFIGLKGYSWSIFPANSDREKENSNTMSQMLSKAKSGVRNLKSKGVIDDDLVYFHKKLKKLKNKRLLQQFWPYMLLVLVIIGVSFGLMFVE
ncbi:MAG: hypothetical protein R2799_13090 [Crocinitomicaceae bacterium]